MLPNLERLKPFIEIYETRSLAAAAKRLHITPGGVSQHLKALEKGLGCQLFIRTKKQAIPTKAAISLFQVVRKFFDDFGEIAREVKGAKLTPSGLLKIAAPMEFSVNFLVPVIATFQEKYPDVSIDVVTSNIPYLVLDKLVKNEFDLAYVDAADTFLRQYPVAGKTVMLEDQVIVGHKSLHRDLKTDFETLSQQKFISHVRAGTDIHFWFKYHFDKIPPATRIALSVDSVRVILQAVQAGAGLGLVPYYLAEAQIKRGDFIVLSGKKGKHYTNRIALAQIPGKKRSLTEKAFEECFKQMYGTHIQR